MAIDYRQSGIDYRDGDYSYQGVETHAIAAAITSTATVAATLVEVAIIDAGEAAITATATVGLAAVVRKVPQPELTLTVNNIIGSSNAEEQQDSLALLVGV